MSFDKFIQPKQIEIGGRKFTISQIPAVDALAIYPVIAKSIYDNGVLGMTMLPVAIVKQILQYTALSEAGVNVVPTSDQLIGDIFNGRNGDLQNLVVEMIRENFDFLITGDLLEKLASLREAPVSGS